MDTERKDAEEFRSDLIAGRARGGAELVFEGRYPLSLDHEHCEVWAIVRLGCLELNTLIKDAQGWREEEGYCLPLGADMARLFEFTAERKEEWTGARRERG